MKTHRLAFRPSSSFPTLGAVALALVATTAGACKISVGTGPDDTDEPTAPEPTASQPATDHEIDTPRMLADVEYLASDELAGRYTHSEDLGVAADYLAAQYREMGIAPVGDASYRVPFDAPDGTRPGDDVTVWVEDGHGGSRQVAGTVLTTLGNGQGEPAYADVVSVPALRRARPRTVKGKIVLTHAPGAGELIEQIQALAELGPAGVVLVGERPPPNADETREPFGSLGFPVAWLDIAAAKEWMGLDVDPRHAIPVPKGMRVSMAAKQETIQRETFNVLAVVPGTSAPEQIVILGAHYDHIGTSDKGRMCRASDGDEICNGADDNASGTAMVLEIARAFTDAHYRPARTVVFAHFAGEELGLYGSKALADKPPKASPFLDGTVVAMVNLDMVGRLGESGLAVGGVGSSDAWMPLLDELEPGDLTIVYERAINARSDHASFYRKKVPVLFFFTGLHADYHQASDHIDKINREGMASIGGLVADLTRALADGHEVPYAEPRSDNEGIVSRMPGSNEATVEKRAACPNCPEQDGDPPTTSGAR